MNIEELAFKDRITLAQLNELVLLDIIEFLQLDRKQWISQFTQTHNESVDIQKENQDLKEQNKKEFADYIKFKKEQYDEYLEKINKLIKENQELKKQLEEYKDKINWYENFEVNKTIDKLRLKHNTQQKEFINYLEKRYKDVTSVIGSYGSNTDLLYGKKYMLEEILQKYKEIIGAEDDTNRL